VMSLFSSLEIFLKEVSPLSMEADVEAVDLTREAVNERCGNLEILLRR